MSGIPDRWSFYAGLQEKLSKKYQIDDYTWGLEAGLNRLLVEGEEFPVVAIIERATQSESRKERYRAQLRRIHLDGEAFVVGTEAVLDTRRRLHLVKTRVTTEDWALLRAISDGDQLKEIAIAKKMAPGSLRAHVFRLRHSLRGLAG